MRHFLLAHGFEKNDRHRSREIKAARAVHRDSEQLLAILLQEAFGQPLGLAPENEKIARMKPDFVRGANDVAPRHVETVAIKVAVASAIHIPIALGRSLRVAAVGIPVFRDRLARRLAAVLVTAFQLGLAPDRLPLVRRNGVRSAGEVPLGWRYSSLSLLLDRLSG